MARAADQRLPMGSRQAGWYRPPIAGYGPQRDKSQMDRAMQALARTRFGGWLFLHVFPIIDRWLIPRTRGGVKVAMGQPIVLLHTRGARSGEPRTTPLLYTPHGEGFIIVASKAGAEHHPAWYHHIRATPDAVAVEIGGRQIQVRARGRGRRARQALAARQRQLQRLSDLPRACRAAASSQSSCSSGK